ncbi:hypothetical protein [Amycolatopsis thermoflava]|uniref:hypothetical protein n=1 Tax=Amycolatopsis thermoflava TaxID=84480 RepID=UPI00041C0397|nr:hypothetical protein [Amycolatopsis thermoflava]
MEDPADPREQATAAKRAALAALSSAASRGQGTKDAPSCAGYYVSAALEYQAATTEFEADHKMAGYAHMVVADAWYHAGEMCEAGTFP